MYKHILSQASSIWLIQLAVILLPIIDTFFLSQISNQNIAAYALANSFYILWMIAGKGLLQGISFAVAVPFGQDNTTHILNLFIQAFWLVLFLTGGAWCLLWLSSTGIQYLSIHDQLKQLAQQYLYIIAFSVPAVFSIRIISSWLQGISKPNAIVVVYWIALVFKFIFTYILFQGYLGSHWQTIMGTALSTALFHWLILILLAPYTWIKIIKKYDISKIVCSIKPNVYYLYSLLCYGLPICFAYLVEFSLFPMITTLLAVHNESVLVAYELSSKLYYLILSPAVAFALASSIWLGQNYQKLPNIQIRHMIKYTEYSIFIFAGLSSSLFYIFSKHWISIYTQDTVIISMIFAVIPMIILRIFSEGLHTLLAFHLRAVDRGWSALIISTIGLWGVSLLSIYILQTLNHLTTHYLWFALAMGYFITWFILRKMLYKLFI